MMASVWANIDLWQSPKSKPQIFTFLSLLAVTNKVSSDEISMAITGSLCPYLCTKNCGGGGCKRQKEKTKHKNKKTSLQSQKSSIYSKQSWSRMEMMTLNESDFDDPLHQCVITCPPDNRLLAKNDKILVLRPFEESPSQLKLGQSSRNLFPSKKMSQ